jgi:arylsulfatase A-like enzyme
MKMKCYLLIILAYFQCSAFTQTTQKPNVIFIVVDDLNDYVEGFEGHPQVQTPNINRIAEKGVSFVNAFCSAPGCAPSRTSLMSGKDVTYTQVYNNDDYDGNFRVNFSPLTANGKVFTIPEVLKDSGGYYTIGINKIFHSQDENDFDASETDDCLREQSWNKIIIQEESEALTQSLLSYSEFPTFGFGKIPDSLEQLLEDYKATNEAIDFIHAYAQGQPVTCDNQPFFLALGYHRPHNGRFIPEKYFPTYYVDDVYASPYTFGYNEPVDRFPYNGIVMPPQPEVKFADYYALPQNGLGRYFSDATTMEGNFTTYASSLEVLPTIETGLMSTSVTDIVIETQRANYVMGYIAAIQYIDAQIGRLLDALEANPALLENTVVVLLSDHGYSLGEKRHYTKWALWETVLRTPLIISTPDMTAAKACDKTVSLLDLFPTICDLTSTVYPTFTNGDRYLDGQSLLPLLLNTDSARYRPAISTYKRYSNVGSCFPHYSVRTDDFHYIRYATNNDGSLGRNVCDATLSVYEEELYEIGKNREIDPYEWNNLASNPEYAHMINYFQQLLPGGNLYNTNLYKAEISNTSVGCFLATKGTLKLKGKLFKPDGTLVSASSSQYIFTWSNNLTTAVYTGRDYSFALTALKSLQRTNDHITFYLHVTEAATGTLIAFTQKTFALNTSNTPTVEFTIGQNVNTITIENYSLSGAYSHVEWNMGDGYITNAEVPGLHVYNTPGTYTITHTIYYGNGCTISTTADVTISNMSYQKSGMENSIRIAPNPASMYIEIIPKDEKRYNECSDPEYVWTTYTIIGCC